jgi:group II intron reverse transcriptase/maturase
LEAEEDEQMGRNENEPHPMSPEMHRTGDKPNPYTMGEGRREEAGQQSEPAQRFGGVSVDGTSASSVKVSWENCGDGNAKSRPSVQAGQTREAGGVAAEVGVPHSSMDLLALDAAFRQELQAGGRRGNTCSTRRGEAKDTGMAGATRLATPDKVRPLQITLYRKAKTAPKYRFWSLYGEVLRRDVLETALAVQQRNGGAAGVDGQRLADITADPARRQQWLEGLQEELKTRTYRPRPVRRVMIPKSSGGERPLGIPTVKDRVVQTAVYLLLMPILEADFHARSYGFRPRHRAQQAIAAINQAAHDGYVEIIDADLSKYFDTIPHRELLKAVARRVSDGSILRLIKSWLRAPVVEEDRDGIKRVLPNRRGTPQGGVISPLLANLYLNPLDHGVNEKTSGQARMVRYADDFVIACRPGQSQGLLPRLKAWLTAKGLTLNEAKTRLVDIRQQGINFLGFNLTWRSYRRRPGGYLHVEPAQKSRAALRQNLGRILNHRTLWRSTGEVVTEANRVLRGWAGYFHYGNSTRIMKQMKNYSQNRLRRWLWRKHDCGRSLWKHYTEERLSAHYGLYALPMTAGWKAGR